MSVKIDEGRRGGHHSASERIDGHAGDIHQALLTCEFPLIVWEFPSVSVLLANPFASELLGIPLDRMVGMPATELLRPVEAVRRTLAMVGSGALDDAHGERSIRRPSGEEIPVRTWLRSVTVDGSRAAVSLLVREEEVAGLGRDPAAPWRDLLAVAVGMADSRLQVRAISDDIREVMGVEADAIIGRFLPDLLGFEASWAAHEDPDLLMAHLATRGARNGTPHLQGCFLLARPSRADDSRVAFAIMKPPAVNGDAAIGRVAELERRLRIIGAEVRAARVLDHVGNLPSLDEHPALRELTTRQWEVLSRLLNGHRPRAIAGELFISPATVRNHLATIFRKFGVHSQPELLAALRNFSVA